MKTHQLILFKTMYWILIAVPFLALSQNKYAGKWEGYFMNDFKTTIEIRGENSANLSGRILMYNNQSLIQDDKLSQIIIEETKLSFMIEAKQTIFNGVFSDNCDQLSGFFIFPDKSEHPIELKKAGIPAISGSLLPTGTLLTDTVFSKDALLQDFDFLVESITNNHPRLYEYISENDYAKLIRKTRSRINDNLSLRRYYQLIAPVTESIKCSHTGIQLPENYIHSLSARRSFLPLKVVFINGRCFLKDNMAGVNQELSPGAEILSINGVQMDGIKKSLHRFIPSEGRNKTTKEYVLNKNFNFLYGLLAPSDAFEVAYTHKGKTGTTVVKACTYPEVDDGMQNQFPDKPLWFTVDSEKARGMLRIEAFHFPDITAYITTMDSLFRELKQAEIQHLVIDLRGNPGGHPIFAAQLFSYLTDTEFIYFKRNEEVREFEPLYHPMQPDKYAYNGKIYVLIDGGCLSTTGHLISLIRHHTNAIFIGEEPGSTFCCNDFSTKKVLPNTRIELNIPRTTFQTAIDPQNASKPFYPEYRLTRPLGDYLDNHDSFYSFLERLIPHP